MALRSVQEATSVESCVPPGQSSFKGKRYNLKQQMPKATYKGLLQSGDEALMHELFKASMLQARSGHFLFMHPWSILAMHVSSHAIPNAVHKMCCPGMCEGAKLEQSCIPAAVTFG